MKEKGKKKKEKKEITQGYQRLTRKSVCCAIQTMGTRGGGWEMTLCFKTKGKKNLN